jgi:hypothetical protein
MKNIYQAICEHYTQNHNFSGACLLKRGGTTIFSGAYGYANRAFHIPNKSDVTCSILANQDCNVWEMHREMQTELYKERYS